MSGFEAAVPYLLAASTAVSVISAVSQGRAAKKAGERNAAVAERNAKVARANAQSNADAEEKDNKRRLGAQIAGYGGSGVAFEGTPLDVLGETAENGEKDIQNILYQGELQALGFQDTASYERFKGSQAQKSSYLSAGGALLQGAAATGYASSRLTTADPTTMAGSAYEFSGPF